MDDNHLWQLYPHDLSLPKNHVHVWCVHLDSSTSQFETLEHSLSSDEIVRANRFYFQKDRDRFICPWNATLNSKSVFVHRSRLFTLLLREIW